MPTILETAQAATKAGIVAMPAKKDGSKAPALPTWAEYQQRHPTKEELRAWFVEQEQDGLGFLCGAISGNLELFEIEYLALAVEFKLAAEAIGLGEELRRIEMGYSEATPGGGVHWLYRLPVPPGGNKKLASKPCPGPPECSKHVPGKPHTLIETRGEGGWVVVAPSGGKTHPDGVYRLAAGGVESIVTISEETRDSLWALARSFDQMPIPVVTPPRDQAVVSLTGEKRPGDRFNESGRWDEILTGWTRLWSHGGLDYWRRPGKEGRHTSATTGMRHKQGAPADLLYVFSTSTEFEAERGYSKFAAYTLLHHNGDYGAATRALATREREAQKTNEWKGLLVTSPQPRIDLETGEVFEDEEVATEADPYAEYFIKWPEFWAQDHTAEQWLVEPVLPRGRGVSMYSKAKVGKSLLALDIAASAATGQRVLQQVFTQPIEVLYIDREMTLSDLQERLIEMGYGPDVNMDHLHYLQLNVLPPLDTVEGGKELLGICERYGIELVVLDTMSRVVQGKENDADTMRDFYRLTGTLLKGAGVTVLRLDHAGKDEEKGQRGTSAKNDDVDLIWQMTPTAQGVRLKATHRRQSWVPEMVDLIILDDPTRHMLSAMSADPPGTPQLVADVLAAGLEGEPSRRKVRAVMKQAGLRARNDVIGAALRILRKDWLEGTITYVHMRSPEIGDHIQPLSDGTGAGTTGTDEPW